jgi:hypothetical protein
MRTKVGRRNFFDVICGRGYFDCWLCYFHYSAHALMPSHFLHRRVEADEGNADAFDY